MTWTLDEDGHLKVVWMQPKSASADTPPPGRLTFRTKAKSIKPAVLFSRTAALTACCRLRKSLGRGHGA